MKNKFISKLLASDADVENLSNIILSLREIEVLKWVAYGKTNSEIATILSLSRSSVRDYIERAKSKLSANNKRYAATMAVRLGFVVLDDRELR